MHKQKPSYFDKRVFTASEAAINPATDGTKATLAGGVFVFSEDIGFFGSSVEKTTFKCAIPRFFNSRRITLAKGQTVVLVISVIVGQLGQACCPFPYSLSLAR